MNPEVSYYTVSSFVSLNPIKSGSGGMISIGELQDSRKMAVKQFKSSREQPLEIFKKEIEILLKYKHPNLVELHGILWDGLNKSVFLGYVMEYIDGGSLNEIIHNHGRLYTQSEICQWIVQIGAGLQYLHDNGILHRDVKPANILVAGDTMKLADLGVAKYSDATTTAGAGTFRYMAPEVLSSGKCSPSSDAFSLAITAWEIFHRKVPYYELGDMTGLALLNKIVAGVRPTIETDKMDKEVAALLRREQFLVFLTLFL